MDINTVAKLKNILDNYESEYYLEMINNKTDSGLSVNISNTEWPVCIYFNTAPPVINGIKPYISDCNCTYKIKSNNIGISLNSPKYIIRQNYKNILNKYELASVKSDIIFIIKCLLESHNKTSS